MTWISLALRNLFRNARRSITTVAAVALGYAAINIFGGFAHYMFASIQDAHIYEQINGHAQIWRKDGRTQADSEPDKYMISAEDFERIKAFAEKDERIEIAAGMLEVRGNLDYDGNVGFFVGQAMVPSEKDAIHSQSTALRSPDGNPYEGNEITNDDTFGVGVTFGMGERLALEVGTPVILMGPSITGQMNAVDAEVFQFIDVASEALDGRYVFLPLDLAQQLYDTDGVTCVRFLLRSERETEEVVAALREEFPADEWDVFMWEDVSKLYHRTRNMFEIIFGLVFVIIATIATMSVLNTIGMAVVERTREIGTLRAIGLKRRGVVRLFGIESMFLGLIGASIGLAVTLAFAGTVAWIEPTWEPPVSARAVVWEIRLVPLYLAVTWVLLIVFTALAAISPARRAAHQSIVDALGHV